MKKRKKEKTTRPGSSILLVIVLLGGLLVGYLYWPSGEKISSQDSCALLPPPDRNECCSRVMREKPHIMCVGEWVWKDNGCYYECSGSGISNPASVKCLEDGGILKIGYSPEGQAGYCFFSDGSVCEEWAYYRGECHSGDCSAYCGAVGTRSEGWYDCHGNLLFWDRCKGKKLPE